MREEYIVVYVTTPNEKTAKKIAKEVLEKRLAACINIIPNIYSTYRWRGRIEEDQEALMIIKTRRGLFDILAKTIKEKHPYEVPEVIGIPIIEGYNAYLEWIRDETKG